VTMSKLVLNSATQEKALRGAPLAGVVRAGLENAEALASVRFLPEALMSEMRKAEPKPLVSAEFGS
jgi:hypothetical protein